MGTEQILLESFLKLISRFKTEDLHKAINENVDLSILAQQHAGDILRIARIFAKIMGVNPDDLSSANVLINLQDKRPDLYREIVLNPKGRPWLEWNLGKFRRML